MCVTIGSAALAQPRDDALNYKLLQIASSAIEHGIWMGATPETRYAVIVDRCESWGIDYRCPPPRRPVVGCVIINKKTMQVTRICFNE